MNLSAQKGPGEVAAEVLMLRNGGFAGTLLIVEGDDDSRFFRARIDHDACDLVIAGGKPAVEGSLQRLDAHPFRGALGVCDDDGASLEGHRPVSPNLIVTECRDLDTLLVRSPALERLLAEYGDRSAIQRFERAHGPVRDNLARLALPFGRLRWLSTRERLGIDFDKLTPFRFIKPDWSFKAGDDLLSAAAKQVHADARDLDARAAALPAVDPWRVCQGHDLLAILALGLDKGALGTRSPGSAQIASLLRASLDEAHWQKSRLVADIHRWETDNTPFTVLRAETRP
jgi:Protein of unknown function (DUF4435)